MCDILCHIIQYIDTLMSHVDFAYTDFQWIIFIFSGTKIE